MVALQEIACLKGRRAKLTGFTVEIIAVGNELLIGKTCDTNSNWLAQQITRLGGKLRRVTLVPDELEEISKVVREALARKPDFLLTVGGLGPTYDDKTLQGVSKALGKPLKLNSEALRMVEEKVRWMAEQGVLKKPWVTPERKKMATLPEGSKPLSNPVGTAPGVLIRKNGTVLISLPGVPSEMKAIFSLHVAGLMAERSNLKYAEGSLLVEGIPEPDLSPTIDEAVKRFPEAYIKSHPKGEEATSRIELHVSTFAESLEKAKGRIGEVIGWLEAEARRLGGNVKKLG